MMKQLFAGLLVFHCCLTLNLAEPSTSGYDYSEPHHHTTYRPTKFSTYHIDYLRRLVYNLGEQVKNLQQSTSASSGVLSSLSAALLALQQTVLAHSSSLTSLFSSIEALTPECPSTAPASAKVLGTYCYWIGTTKKTLGDASTSCRAGGGTLAEPLPALGVPLRNELEDAFGSVFSTIGATSNLWIGIDNYDDNVAATVNRLIYLTTNQRVPGLGVPSVTGFATTHYGTLLKPDGTFTYETLPTLNYYVCESTHF